MRTIATRNSMAVTIIGTTIFYVAFAALVTLKPALLASLAEPTHPLLSKLIFPIWRGISSMIFIVGTALAIYATYRLLITTQWFRSRRIATNRPPPGQIMRETLLNANFTLAAAIQGMVFMVLTELGHSRIYPIIGERGWVYAILSLFVFVVLADAWFYFWHRFYHRSYFVYCNVHSVHHLSVVTTPMTNSQISSWELLPSGVFGVAFVMTVPIAMPVMSLLIVFVAVYQMILHSGYEIFPRGTPDHWLGQWLVTPTYHQMHHELYNKHLGLYFNWWDRLLGTYSNEYSHRFAQVTDANGKLTVTR